MPNKTRIRERLQTRLGVLLAQLKEIEQMMREPEDDDLEEQASEWDDDVVQDGLARLIREEIGLSQEALRRLEEGTYERCECCGKLIGQRRLRALPQATGCVRCARVVA